MANPATSTPGRFFIIGPLRTGSSLLSRCLDDHPDCICLCESEVNRALFPEYDVQYHYWRMMAHGLTLDEAIGFLNLRKQDDLSSFKGWYSAVLPRLSDLYGKENVVMLGDKSPDLFRSPALIRHLSESYPLLYSVRDPRAIFSSIEGQDDSSVEEKAIRWESLIQNYLAWKPHLDSPNILIVRYEDLVASPSETMALVYQHLGLRPSQRFLMSFRRAFPERFLWSTAVDYATGMKQDFEPRRITSWRATLSAEHLDRIRESQVVLEFMERFGYRDEF
ncbi:sulfotransferase family protein [Singulisphaera rosea]